MSQVIATAGHVDHGKSTLVRALSGIEPDRLAEERRRGLTIELGFAGTTLPSGREIAFVDVPGHERFLATMLTGLGPAPLVCFVVAADGGWSAQSSDHRDAIAALGLDQGLLVITRTDLAPDRTLEVTARAREELAGTGLADVPAVAVSARTGEGMETLREVLDEVVAGARTPDETADVRLWVDRSFSLPGAGTVVTGTLGAGTLRVGDELDLVGAGQARRTTVRALQSGGEDAEQLGPVRRTAVNLRGAEAGSIHRGDALLTPGAWDLIGVVDARVDLCGALGDLGAAPAELVAHAGTAAVPVRLRPLGGPHARLTLDRPLPLRCGDRIVLRGSGEHPLLGGALVLDVDPPVLTRRGDAARRAAALAGIGADGDAAGIILRHGAVPSGRLVRQGVRLPDPLPEGIARAGDLLVDREAQVAWSRRLAELVDAEHTARPLSAGLPLKAALDALAARRDDARTGTRAGPAGPATPPLPAALGPALLPSLLRAASLVERDGRLVDPVRAGGLGQAEESITRLEERLRGAPFAAPEAEELAALGLGPEQLAAAARQGRILRLPGEVVLLPPAAALAMRELARLEQPFTASAARQALGTTRRVAIPLLEHLDRRGWTRRVDAGRREIVR
ncbi:selenocysteine-specific translation elongation factor [Brachybacterium sp. J153]|uniref:selenocysteine-specific translation elongation factor n=1 Tax=Brachybacterium sp. J153 TaxID=3116488 RepID=UPI002E775B50|nr:SelB C-terminal domain-containing protein [Brachybacterium sp. J153]MEE1618919.1 SelB C-terminal domain-containing protein [Brachybacterium sp. J153]